MLPCKKSQSPHTCICRESWKSLKSGLCANNIELSICNTPSSDEHLAVSHWWRADITILWLANFNISYVLQLSQPAHPDIIIDFRQEGGNLNLYIEPFTRCSPAQQSALFHEISPLAQNQYLQCKLAPDNCCLHCSCLLFIHKSVLIRFSISCQIRFVLNLSIKELIHFHNVNYKIYRFALFCTCWQVCTSTTGDFYFAFKKGLLKGQIWECISKNPKVSYVLRRMGTLLISKEQINIPISDAETKRSPCIATFHL